MTDHQAPRHRIGGKARPGLFAAGLLALGGATGAVVTAETRPSVTMAPATPVAIRALSASSTGIVTVRGRVAEVYGNKFIIEDGSGRALVDTGREGDRAALVTVGQTVTVQGRFDRGFVHAAFLVGADGKVQALGPLAGPPPHGPHGGPGRDRNAPPPPPGGDDKAPPPPGDAPAPQQ